MEKNFRIFFRHGNNAKDMAIIQAESLDDALTRFCESCINNDFTGIFFELENADVEYYMDDSRFHKVTVNGIEYGTLIDKYEEV